MENDPVNLVDPFGLEFLFGSNWWQIFNPYRLRPFLPRGIPKTTPNQVKPGPAYPKGPGPGDIKIPPDDFYWQQDPFPVRPKPFNPNKPMIPGPQIPIPNPNKGNKPDCNDPPKPKPWPSTPEEWDECFQMGLCA